MTTKPKARKAPAAGDDINPKLTARAVKLADAWTQWRRASALEEIGGDEADEAQGVAIEKVSDLEKALARVPATNLPELRLKAKYADLDFVNDPLTVSIVRDLRKLNRKREAS
jgi:hypothetical protein